MAEKPASPEFRRGSSPHTGSPGSASPHTGSPQAGSPQAGSLHAGAPHIASPHGTAGRSGTRERIQSIALELFAEQGYEKTSLREIAERLGVTKAALYYHFKSKEDIVASFIEDYRSALGEVIAWGASQPRTARTRAEILARYATIVSERLEIIRFMEQNQAAMHTLMPDRAKQRKFFRDQFAGLAELLTPPGAGLADRVRAAMSVVTIGMGTLLFQHDAASPGELRDAVLGVACDLASAPAAD